MNILTEPVPGHWPAEAKTLVNDLRRAYRALEESFDSEEYVLKVDPDLSHQAVMEAKGFGFTPAEAKIWRALRSNSRGVWTKDSLFTAIHPTDSVRADMKIVDVLICKMRKRLFVAKAPWMIKTFWGKGYQLVSPASVADGLITSQKVDANKRAELLASIPVDGGFNWQHVKPALLGLGLSQVAMAKKLGVTSRKVFEWCNGASYMPDRPRRIIAGMVGAERYRLAGTNYRHLSASVIRVLDRDNANASRIAA
jgi:two-component system cell cycle response regulator CtrA